MAKHKLNMLSQAEDIDSEELGPEMREIFNRLTEKQKRFYDVWTGNATETARIVGYKDARNAGYRCLKNADIRRLIKAKRDAELTPEILTRLERQAFWSRVALDPKASIRDRLRASELLGKSQGDFLDANHVDTGPKFIAVGFVDDRS